VSSKLRLKDHRLATHDFDKIFAVKQNVQGRLLAIPGVHTVAFGAKWVGGQRTQEPAIMVYVEKKKPAIELLPHELIPTEIDGVKTDVLESSPPRLTSEDTEKHRPLDGGVQIRCGGSVGIGGTLGCIARIPGAVPKIVGITNQHCVGHPPRASVATLVVVIDPQPALNAMTITGENLEGTLIIVDLAPRQEPADRAYYRTTQKDTLSTIATGIAKTIGSIGGYSASVLGERVTITKDNGNQFAHDARVFGPHFYNERADLGTNIEGNEITFIGKTSDSYGIFTNWNGGKGVVASDGVFTRVRKGMTLTDVATRVAATIHALGLPNLDASSTGSKVIINGAQQADCDVSTDVRVGQPEDSFCSACSPCCSDLIGDVTDARLKLDIALIELKGDLEYFAEIEGIGVIKGTHTYSPAEVLAKPIRVRKRGAKTGFTTGFLEAIAGFGEVIEVGKTGTPAKEWLLFHRHYASHLIIKSSPEFKQFSDHGDSGAALVNDDNEVIGILWGGADRESRATPIAEIEAAFKLVVETETVAHKVKTVPATQGHAFAIVQPEPLFVDRLREVEREITATPAGRELGEVGRRHAHEVVQLVNHNRRVGTVWRRNGGPEIVQIALTMAQTGEKDLARQFNGSSLGECLRKMQAILERYGSAQLAADLRRYGPRIIELTKFDYPQLLVALKAAQ
jgi:hypothetical protein